MNTSAQCCERPSKWQDKRSMLHSFNLSIFRASVQSHLSLQDEMFGKSTVQKSSGIRFSSLTQRWYKIQENLWSENAPYRSDCPRFVFLRGLVKLPRDVHIVGFPLTNYQTPFQYIKKGVTKRWRQTLFTKAEPLLPYKERMIDGSESPNARGSFLFEGRVSMKSVVITKVQNSIK